MKRLYVRPSLMEYGDVSSLTGTLGAPFTGDTSFDLDGDIIVSGQNSIDQCPTRNRRNCVRS